MFLRKEQAILRKEQSERQKKIFTRNKLNNKLKNLELEKLKN